MPKRGGRRVQLKKIKFLIKQTLSSSKDPLPLFTKLHKVNNPKSPEPQSNEIPSSDNSNDNSQLFEPNSEFDVDLSINCTNRFFYFS